jgi:hypothetical protein
MIDILIDSVFVLNTCVFILCIYLALVSENNYFDNKQN